MINVEASRLREPAAWLMAAVASAIVLVGIERLLFGGSAFGDSSFAARAAARLGTFTSPVTVALLVGAVVLATHLGPVIARLRPLALLVTVTLGLCVLFGLIALLAGVLGGATSAREKIELLLVHLPSLALAAVALLYVLPRAIPAASRAGGVSGPLFGGQGHGPVPGYGPAGGQGPFQGQGQGQGPSREHAPFQGAPDGRGPRDGYPQDGDRYPQPQSGDGYAHPQGAPGQGPHSQGPHFQGAPGQGPHTGQHLPQQGFHPQDRPAQEMQPAQSPPPHVPYGRPALPPAPAHASTGTPAENTAQNVPSGGYDGHSSAPTGDGHHSQAGHPRQPENRQQAEDQTWPGRSRTPEQQASQRPAQESVPLSAPPVGHAPSPYTAADAPPAPPVTPYDAPSLSSASSAPAEQQDRTEPRLPDPLSFDPSYSPDPSHGRPDPAYGQSSSDPAYGRPDPQDPGHRSDAPAYGWQEATSPGSSGRHSETQGTGRTEQGSYPQPEQQGSYPQPEQQGSYPQPEQQGSYPQPEQQADPRTEQWATAGYAQPETQGYAQTGPDDRRRTEAQEREQGRRAESRRSGYGQHHSSPRLPDPLSSESFTSNPRLPDPLSSDPLPESFTSSPRLPDPLSSESFTSNPRLPDPLSSESAYGRPEPRDQGPQESYGRQEPSPAEPSGWYTDSQAPGADRSEQWARGGPEQGHGSEPQAHGFPEPQGYLRPEPEDRPHPGSQGSGYRQDPQGFGQQGPYTPDLQAAPRAHRPERQVPGGQAGVPLAPDDVSASPFEDRPSPFEDRAPHGFPTPPENYGGPVAGHPGADPSYSTAPDLHYPTPDPVDLRSQQMAQAYQQAKNYQQAHGNESPLRLPEYGAPGHGDPLGHPQTPQASQHPQPSQDRYPQTPSPQAPQEQYPQAQPFQPQSPQDRYSQARPAYDPSSQDRYSQAQQPPYDPAQQYPPRDEQRWEPESEATLRFDPAAYRDDPLGAPAPPPAAPAHAPETWDSKPIDPTAIYRPEQRRGQVTDEETPDTEKVGPGQDQNISWYGSDRRER
ncbi:hypothetical protein ACIBCT_04465 [Streptosporangium sp. NPDC050855]|uniref:hypothetical protein n=1 Tax=Streptosporangium sp. NPDC050855 TaxID=3366194 RepID=UPI0037B22507